MRRLQIGVQHTDDAVLTKINRGCLHADTVRGIRLLKNSGYKMDIHLMSNLPEMDMAMFEEVLSDDLVQADQWKWHEQGKYVAHSLEKMMDVVGTSGITLVCRCIRCREVGTHVRKGTLVASAVDASRLRVRVRVRVQMATVWTLCSTLCAVQTIRDDGGLSMCYSRLCFYFPVFVSIFCVS